MRATLLGIVLAATVLAPLDGLQPALRVSGGISPNGIAQPLLFTWNTAVTVAGSGWAPGESIRLFLHGPLDSPDVQPRRLSRVSSRIRVGREPVGNPASTVPDIPLGAFTADPAGNLAAAPTIPYDNGIVGSQARITRPGYYQVVAFGSTSGWASANDGISICPDTAKPATAPDWGRDRGGRDGVFPDPFHQYSPERMDPEWPSAWSESPVELYGTIAPTGVDGGDQPARISHTDNPPTHFAHDATFYVTPDPAYRWLVGTANYFEDDPNEPGRGTLEVEWETQNAGDTSTYSKGNIGLPLWANPTAGDRVYTVGRWILDAGHPEEGDRTEIHPPRLMAAIRARPALSGSAAAQQVDLYVSGHGGGANTMPPGLSGILDQGGHGGGRLRDVLTPAEQDRYYRPGPLAPLLVPLLNTIVRQVAGAGLSATVYPDAGPSAFPWGAAGPEFRPVNDRDYDFDVPLPFAGSRVEVITHPEHTTSVNEEITYRGAVAHVRLPYRGAGNGIYARTLKFLPATSSQPPSHYTVRLNRIDVAAEGGKWQLWADVAGQWSYLGPLNTPATGSVALPGTPVDVYLNANQTLRVFVHGYHATCIDDYFGKLFGQSSYVAGLNFVAACGPVDNVNVGGAVAELPAAAARGAHTITSNTRAFSITFTVE